MDTQVATHATNIVNLRELEARARAVLPKPYFDYIAGGSGDEWTMNENLRAFKRTTIVPHFIGDHRPIDMSVTLLGQRFSSPILICPMGQHAMAHDAAEAGTAAGAGAEDVLLTVSAMSTLTLEQIATVGQAGKWFHYYLPADRGEARELLHRAKAAGYTAIVFAVDTGGSPRRERNIRNDFQSDTLALGNFPDGPRLVTGISWDDVAFVQKESGLPLILKGVLAESIVKRAIRQGIAGIQISNHGGRAVDDSPATITVLPRLAEAADGKLTIILDGGVRRGNDVFKALALGAHAVGIGRPILYALALGGAAAVQEVLAQLKAEFRSAMDACGCGMVSSIDRNFIGAW